MICNSSRIDPAARRLITAIAATREARIAAMALDHHGGGARPLLEAGLLVRRGSTTVCVAEDDLDDAPTMIASHPIDGSIGQLGNSAWQVEADSAVRRLYALDMPAITRRVLARIDCTLGAEPVSYINGAVLDFGTARLPRRTARVGIWLARGLTAPLRMEALRELAGRRPSDGLRVIVTLDPASRLRPSFLKSHEIVALEDVVDHEDGLAVHPDILSARLLKGPFEEGPVWASGDGAVLIVHGERFDFKGSKQKVAVRMMAEGFNAGERRLSSDVVFEEACCGPTVRRLSELFKGHPAWKRVIFESGASCWIEA